MRHAAALRNAKDRGLALALTPTLTLTLALTLALTLTLAPSRGAPGHDLP